MASWKNILKYAIGAALAAVWLHDGFANAADLKNAPIYKAPEAPIGVAYDAFTGGYIGVNGGYGWNLGDGVQIGQFVPLANLANSPQGFVGGVQAGYGHRFAGWAYAGIEGDIDGAALSGSATMPGLITGTSKNTWLASIRFEGGIIPVGHALIYGTVGAGFGGGSFTINELFSGQTVGTNPTLSGLVWGGGVKFPLSPNWIVDVKYLQYDFGTQNLGSPTVPGLTFAMKDRIDVIRAGLNYKF